MPDLNKLANRDLYDEDWKGAVTAVPKKLMNHLSRIVCKQTDCSSRGKPYEGNCAFCADIADNVIGEYLILTETSDA
jgi:hypothetical protein